MATLPIIKGSLDILVLTALRQGHMHGFEITTWLEEQSGGSLEVEDSALYQALYRMEARSLVSATWGVTENNRRARYYKILAAGRKHLEREATQWTQYAATVTQILTTTAAERA